MQKNFKDQIETQYKDIFNNLYVRWMFQQKLKYQELSQKGLLNTGAASNAMDILIDNLIDQTIVEIHKLFTNLPIKYNRKISLKDLKYYKEKTKNNIEGHIKNMKNDLDEKYKDKMIFLSQSKEIIINNSKIKIEKNFNEIVNLKRGKKIEGLVAFNVAFTILGFFLGVAELIANIISIFNKQ